jgi:transposase
MKTDITVTTEERVRLAGLIADRNSPAKVVWRSRIVLATADGESVKAICRATGMSKPCVWRWQKRFAEYGVDGLLRDKTRPPGRKPLAAATKAKLLAKTARETPPDATHWSVRTMAKAMGISRTSVQRIWREAGLKPHLTARFKVSNDPQFEEKVTDIVGLYMNPPDHALVLCVDEKSQIQALDRTQPGLPLKKGRAATATHDYKRNGVTTLYAAMDEERPRHRRRQPRHRARVHRLPAADRSDREEAPRRARRARQLLDAQDGGGEDLARQASALQASLHADQRLVDEPCRALLRGDYEEAHPTRRLRQRR